MADRLLRTFIAIAVPGRVKTVQEMLKSTLDHSRKSIRWMRSGAIHLTLKFNGPTPGEIVPKITSRLDNLAAAFQPFELEITGTGCFPDPRRPRVLWLGVGGAVEPLRDLTARIHRALSPLGFPDEGSQFTPHVTIGRLRYPQKHTPDITRFLQTAYQSIPVEVDRIHLISSELLPEGPVYMTLGTSYFSPESEKE